ncbi:MAG: stage III sporulation protein AG [Clostridiales bacterium]|nr:stage III sporulation protein AG [Clostridiales bacterium]
MEEKKEKVLKKEKLTIKEIGIDKLLIILLVGVALVVLSFPEGKKSKIPTNETESIKEIAITEDTYERLLEERLKNTLSKVEGVGQNDIMITIKTTSEKIVLKENPYTNNTTTETDSEGGSRNSTEISQSDSAVYIEESDGSKTPYVIKEIEPKIEGVVVIAQGGNKAAIVSEIMDAVAALFDVPSHKIKVLKMKIAS